MTGSVEPVTSWERVPLTAGTRLSCRRGGKTSVVPTGWATSLVPPGWETFGRRGGRPSVGGVGDLRSAVSAGSETRAERESACVTRAEFVMTRDEALWLRRSVADADGNSVATIEEAGRSVAIVVDDMAV